MSWEFFLSSIQEIEHKSGMRYKAAIKRSGINDMR